MERKKPSALMVEASIIEANRNTQGYAIPRPMRMVRTMIPSESGMIPVDLDMNTRSVFPVPVKS